MAKWNLSPSAQPQTAAGEASQKVVVEIPALLSLRALGAGQSFPLGVSLDGGRTFDTREARLIGDGQSLLWGERILRLPGSITVLPKAGHLRLGSGPYAQRVHLKAEPERAVKIKGKSGAPGGGMVKAPMTGKVLAVLVQEGQSVAEGDPLLTIEAMKMENRILADWAGVVRQVKAQPGSMSTLGDLLLVIEAADAAPSP